MSASIFFTASFGVYDNFYFENKLAVLNASSSVLIFNRDCTKAYVTIVLGFARNRTLEYNSRHVVTQKVIVKQSQVVRNFISESQYLMPV